MVLGAAFDSNVMSYHVLIIMKAQGVLVGRGGADPRMSGEAEPSHQGSGEAEPTLGGRARRNQSSVIWTRNAVVFPS